MTIESRKIEFVQAFLKLQNDEVISQFESLLKKKSILSNVQDSEFKPMSINEFNERIQGLCDAGQCGGYGRGCHHRCRL